MTPGRNESPAAGHEIYSRTDGHTVTGQDETWDNVLLSTCTAHIQHTPHYSQLSLY